MNQNRKIFGRKSAAVLLAALMTMAVPMAGYGAAAPMTGMEALSEDEASAYGPALDETIGAPAKNEEQIPKELLEDNVLEYREIGARIENYSGTYLSAKTSLYDAYLSLDAAREIAAEASELMEDARDIKTSDMDEETRQLYESYKEAAQELRKQAQSMTNEELPSAGKRTLRQAKNNLTKVVQNLMITYQTTEAQAAVANKNAELSQASLEARQRMAELGMASQEEVLEAMKTLQQAQSGAQQASSGLQNLRQNILLLLGWEHNAEITFAPIGEPDTGRIAAINLEEDKRAAVGANTDLYTLRGTAASGAVNRSIRKRNISMTEQSVKVQIENLYASVLAKKQAYDAAVSEFSAAAQTMASAERMYSLGMMGNLEYLGSQLAYLNAEAGYTGASLALFQAMEDYDWAVNGLITTSGG